MACLLSRLLSVSSHVYRMHAGTSEGSVPTLSQHTVNQT